jgi:esterase/lipase superfamily enzyme
VAARETEQEQHRVKHQGFRTGWLIAGLGALAVLGGCASRPPSVMAPVASIPADARIVDLLVSTTRRPDSNPSMMFGGNRTLRSNYASLAVSIPPGHKPGDIAWSSTAPPDPNASFATARAAYLEREGFVGALRQRIRASGRSHVMVFVHGYNTRFDEAAFRFAQIVNDSDAKVVPVLFSWASWGTLAAYTYDRTSAEVARNGLEGLLSLLAKDPAVSEVSVLAHSMGGWLALESLRQMSIRDGRVNGKIRNLMLAAPDVDVDVALEQGRAIGANGPRVSLFVSRDDRALDVSKFIWGSRDRLGSIDPNEEPYRTNLAKHGVEVIDLTDVKSDDRSGHGKFAQSPEVVRSIGVRLASGQQLANRVGSLGDSASVLTQGTLTAVGKVLTSPLTIGQDHDGPKAEAP